MDTRVSRQVRGGPDQVVHRRGKECHEEAGFPLTVRLVFNAIGAIEIRLFGANK